MRKSIKDSFPELLKLLDSLGMKVLDVQDGGEVQRAVCVCVCVRV